jgi:hypothetical protein
MTYTKIVIPEESRIEATKWARACFGKSKGENGELRWDQLVWYMQKTKTGVGVYFRNPEHATMFALRWS